MMVKGGELMFNKIIDFVKHNGLIIILLGIICLLAALNLYDLKYAFYPNLKLIFIVYILSYFFFCFFYHFNINKCN